MLRKYDFWLKNARTFTDENGFGGTGAGGGAHGLVDRFSCLALGASPAYSLHRTWSPRDLCVTVMEEFGARSPEFTFQFNHLLALQSWMIYIKKKKKSPGASVFPSVKWGHEFNC